MRFSRFAVRCRVLPVVLAAGFVAPPPGAGQAPAGAAATAESRGALPSIACVVAIRDARLAAAGKDAAALTTSRQTLEAAIELPGCELPALSGLLQLLRLAGNDPAAAAVLRERLATRISDPATELPDGLLTQLAADGGERGGSASDVGFLAALERRVALSDASGRALSVTERVEILTVTVDLQDRLGREEAARATLDRLIALKPTYALRWRALLHDVAHGRWQQAAELLAPMVAVAEATDAARIYYVEALAHLGRYDEMLVQLEKLAPPPPGASTSGSAVVLAPPAAAGSQLGLDGFATLLADAAWALRDAGRDAEAAALFRRLLLYAPENKEAQLVLVHLYGSAEERAAAAAASATRRQEETDPVALFEEGSDLLGAGDTAGAMELLARAAPELGDSQYSEPAWYNLGTAAFKLERWSEAERAFAEAIRINGERTESHWKRGISLYHLERWQEAIAELGRTLELQADKRDAHYYLAICHRQLGDAAAAARESALFDKPR